MKKTTMSLYAELLAFNQMLVYIVRIQWAWEYLVKDFFIRGINVRTPPSCNKGIDFIFSQSP